MSHTYRQDLNWLVTDFTTRVADVAHAIVVSADGVPLGLSARIPEGSAGQFAAIISGLVSLMQGAARIFEAGQPAQALVEMEGGLMLVMAISDGSSLAVLAAPECDTDLVSYEMTLLVEAVGHVLTPAIRSHQGPGHSPKGPVTVTATPPERMPLLSVMRVTSDYRSLFRVNYLHREDFVHLYDELFTPGKSLRDHEGYSELPDHGVLAMAAHQARACIPFVRVQGDRSVFPGPEGEGRGPRPSIEQGRGPGPHSVPAPPGGHGAYAGNAAPSAGSRRPGTSGRRRRMRNPARNPLSSALNKPPWAALTRTYACIGDMGAPE